MQMPLRAQRATLVVLFMVAMQIVNPNGGAAKDEPSGAPQAKEPDSIVQPGYEEIDRKLSEFIERELKDKDIPALSIALVEGDRVVVARGFGAASADGKKPATAQSVYRVGSVSKLFTDLCVMQLVAAGK